MITGDILNWIKTLPKWQQKLSYLLMENMNIDEAVLMDVFRIFKIEKSLEKGSIPDDITPIKIENSNEHCNAVWSGVENLHGVNRLKSDEKLSVSEGLTLIYGENGSGKSGYTRLLNQAFISRGDQEILGNVYSSKKEDISANFTFNVDGNEVELSYPKDKDEYPFKIIRNFDSRSAISDMTEESVIDFAPSELSFFDLLLSYSTLIQKKLDDECESKRIENPVIKYFNKEGEALNQMRNLSATTEISKLKKMFYIEDKEKEQYERTKGEKANLKALDINKQTTLIDNVLSFLKEALKKSNNFFDVISSENIDVYNRQIEFFNKCKLVNNKNGLEMFKNENIELIGSSEWKEFLKSAKIYYDKISNHNSCPLCGNKIYEKDLIFKYWKYLESDSENNYKVAKEAIRISTETLIKVDLSFLADSSIQEYWLMNNFKEETKIINKFFVEAEKYKNQLIASLEKGHLITEVFNFAAPNLDGLIAQVIEKKESLNQENINKKIVEYSKFEDMYVDKIKINELIPIITQYVDYLKWEELAKKSKINTRTITNKQKELFEKYVTDDYLKTFKSECNKLNANFDIEIVSRGRSGQTLKKLQIKGNVPGKILSEGEQRAISIANFLTEVQMDKENKGIVLDDPVSSLDHKRRTQIVKRLLEEACCRQVIIFTHEIAFFMEMKIQAEKSGIIFQQETIRKICNEPGNISSVIPWQGMGVKDRTGKLKNDLQKINSVFNAGDMDKYYYEAKQWCELLRESWERAVEEVLFNDAIQRYNPCVQTQRLKKAPFSQELYNELENGMTECSSWCHDQARAMNGNIPSVEDLKKYIDSFEKYCKKYRA